MNKEKRSNYRLTASIHTLSVKSPLVDSIDDCVSGCITANSRDGITTSIINPNKLLGDMFTYEDFQTAFDTILAGAGICDYQIVRADMRFDSYESEHYRDFMKLNRYLISALAVTYKVQNNYRTTDLFSQRQLTVAIKNKYFECENYDKEAESGGKDLAFSRFEERSKHWTHNDLEKEFTQGWFNRWDKAMKNLPAVNTAYNDALEQLYMTDRKAYPVRFRSLTDFLIQYQDCIFTKAQMVDLLSRFPEVRNPKTRAENYKKRYGIEYFSKNDVRYAIKEIKRATKEFFQVQKGYGSEPF